MNKLNKNSVLEILHRKYGKSTIQKEISSNGNDLIKDDFHLDKDISYKNGISLKSFRLEELQISEGIASELRKLICEFALGNVSLTEEFFVKLLLTKGISPDFDIAKVFEKEVATYDFFKDVSQKVPLIEEALATCYFSKKDIIVLEDLNRAGFVQQDIERLPTFGEVEIALEALAKIHASCIIYEEKCKEELKEKNVEENNPKEEIIRSNQQFSAKQTHSKAFVELYLNQTFGSSYMNCLAKGILYQIDLYKIDIKKLSNGHNFAENLHRMQNLLNLAGPSTKYRNVMTHCDLNHGNIFMKYENFENGLPNFEKPLQCKIIDYQIGRYKPPAHDVACLLFTNTSRKFREENLDKLLKIYYEKFSSFLRFYQVNPDDILTFEDLLQSYEEEKPLATYYELKTTPIVLLSKENKQHMNETGLLSKVFYDSFEWIFKTFTDTSDLFKERCIDGIWDLKEVLDKNYI